MTTDKNRDYARDRAAAVARIRAEMDKPPSAHGDRFIPGGDEARSAADAGIQITKRRPNEFPPTRLAVDVTPQPTGKEQPERRRPGWLACFTKPGEELYAPGLSSGEWAAFFLGSAVSLLLILLLACLA